MIFDVDILCVHIPLLGGLSLQDPELEFDHQHFPAQGQIEVPEHAHRHPSGFAWLEAEHHWSDHCPVCVSMETCVQWVSVEHGVRKVSVIHGVPRIHHS